MVGARRRKLTNFPDYLLEVDDKYVWVLDAKDPNENITSGRNVEQVYFYAIHPEIRAPWFALCNGKEFICFDISIQQPILHFNLSDIEKYWNELKRLLSSESCAASMPEVKPVPIMKEEFDYSSVKPLKENRKLAVSGEAKQRGQYVAVSMLEVAAATTRQIRLEAVAFPLLLTKEVFTNEASSVGVRYLVSSDLTLSFDKLTKLYQKRWSLEVYHKSLKQNASLEKSPTRTTTTQRNHLFVSLCAYVKLEALKLKTGVVHFTLKSKIYLSALKAAYAEVVKLNPQPLAA